MVINGSTKVVIVFVRCYNISRHLNDNKVSMCINKIFCQIMKQSVKRQSFKRHRKYILTNKTNSAIKKA
jgi:hypothetical protein